MRRSAAALLAIVLALTLANPIVLAWSKLEEFRGDKAYLLYEVVYKVSVSGQVASGEARGSYLLHVLIESYNRTHYLVSALADSITYSFTSDNPVFLHVLASLFLVNLSKQFIELLYVPPAEGVTLKVAVEGGRVAQFLNTLTRWYNIVEDTSRETCFEVALGNLTIAKGIKYRIPTLGAELVYDCPSGLLVSLRAQIADSYGDLKTEALISVELAKTNLLELTSIKPPTATDKAFLDNTTALVLAVSAVAVALAVTILIVVLRRFRK